MKTPKLAIACLLVAQLVGCAAYKPVPDGYTGPTATVADHAEYETGGKGRFFILEAVDGNRVENSVSASRDASYGKGFSLTIRHVDRKVPIRPMKVQITGTHATAAPIHEFASRMAGAFFTVSGTVDFSPEAGKSYIVTGDLTKEVAAVWIVDIDSKQVVTEKVTAK